jgi:hypothetical protein
MVVGPLDFWIDWTSQIGVLSSLGFQIILHLFANVRRRSSSIMLRVPLWLAYQLSDMTATYAAGQLLYSSRTPEDHQLIAFWAPFLLLHLGGPDNITAYALEDNKLWTRHLLSLGVQVLGAGYVLYKHIAGSGIFLTLAAILVFVVGVAKYAERTCALWFANFSTVQSSLKVLAHEKHRRYSHIVEHQAVACCCCKGGLDQDELDLLRAHSLFHICKRGMVDSVIPAEVDNEEREIIRGLRLRGNHESMWRVMEMELSLMYDILYTKASVTHSWVGYCIRAISPVAIFASLVLFQLSSKDGYRRVDVGITYTLLGGALVLETKSLLGALGSSWALAFLCGTQWDGLRHSAVSSGRWYRLRRALVSLRRSWPGKIIMTGTSRKWSGTMGQHNMLRFRAGQVDPMSRRLGHLFSFLGLREWWDRRYYSCTIIVPDEVLKHAQKVNTWVSRDDINTMGLLRHKWGELGLGEKWYPGLFTKLKRWHGVDFHESIISWHIATDLIFAAMEKNGHGASDDSVAIVRALSNYMMFLLVDRPDMLPGLPQNWLYEQTCNKLDKLCQKHPVRSPADICTVFKKFFRPRHHWDLRPTTLEKDFAEKIRTLDLTERSGSENPRLNYALQIAKVIEGEPHDDKGKVKLLLDLWTDFLVHAANRCSRESHARKLSSGGEFTTILWLVIEHLCQIKE